MTRKAVAKPHRVLCTLDRNQKGDRWLVRRMAVTDQGCVDLEPVKGFQDPTAAIEWINHMAQRDPAYQPYPPAVEDEEEYELELPPEDYEPYEEDEDDEED